MKICEDCFGKLWPGLLAQAQPKGKVLHIEKCEVRKSPWGDLVADKCDYCGHERAIVFKIWFEG